MSEISTYHVELTYFKTSGKYYSDGEFEASVDLALWEIFDLVQSKLDNGNLPGLVHGAKEFYVLINVPNHPYNHPHLCIPTGNL
jgi:hypothetical protein